VSFLDGSPPFDCVTVTLTLRCHKGNALVHLAPREFSSLGAPQFLRTRLWLLLLAVSGEQPFLN